jgi:hypothetical protein
MTMEPEDLPGVVREIATTLLNGDWTRWADDSRDRFYYIIRKRDHAAEVSDDFSHGFVLETQQPDVFEDWYVRAALAEEPADRLSKARARVVAAGIDGTLFDGVVEAARTAVSLADFHKVVLEAFPQFVTDSRMEAAAALLQALRIDRTRKGDISISEKDRPAIRRAMEAFFLRELAQRFPKVIKRAVVLDWLSFRDPQLREACRCYLYGFLRAAVLVAAAAVEERLKAVAHVEGLDKYRVLVDSVYGKAGMRKYDSSRASDLKDLFELRNDVAHEAVEPSAEKAAWALTLVRDTLDNLTDPEE